MIPAWLEVGALVAMLVVIAADLALAFLRPRVPKPREAAIWIAFYVLLALVFAGLLYLNGGVNPSGQFLAGWLTEYSLSVDNLFVFVIIMGRFAVPKELQQSVLLVGIIIALVLRGIFILLGVTLITHFSWIFYIFGAFLLYTAVHQLVSNGSQDSDEESRAIRFLRRHIPITPDFNGTHLTVRTDGRRMLTPILLVFVAIGTTDLLFALDSIPAVFGITQDPFLVFAANVFALMGLRQLYFLLGHLIDRLVYLTYGITLILVFIAVKLIFHALHDNHVIFINGGKPVEWAPEFGTITSLAVIVLSIALSVGASLIKLRIDARRAAGSASDTH
jgi:tellurite resistance protein TerC